MGKKIAFIILSVTALSACTPGSACRDKSTEKEEQLARLAQDESKSVEGDVTSTESAPSEPRDLSAAMDTTPPGSKHMAPASPSQTAADIGLIAHTPDLDDSQKSRSCKPEKSMVPANLPPSVQISVQDPARPAMFSNGSGVLVWGPKDGKPYLMTALHLFEDALQHDRLGGQGDSTIRLKFNGKNIRLSTKSVITNMLRHPENEAVMIPVDLEDLGISRDKVANLSARRPRKNEMLFTTGFPAYNNGNFDVMAFCTKDKDNGGITVDGQRKLTFVTYGGVSSSEKPTSGFSGGPVFDAEGNVFGIHSGYRADKQKDGRYEVVFAPVLGDKADNGQMIRLGSNASHN